MEKTKAETFLGFVVKTGRYKLGQTAIGTLKRANLIIVCHSASENSKKVAESFAKKFNCPLLTIVKPLEEVINKENAKMMAITDKPLSVSILENKGTLFLN